MGLKGHSTVGLCKSNRFPLYYSHARKIGIIKLVYLYAFKGECLKTRWTVIRKIGGGGFGQIFEAWDKDKRQRVAIKVV